MDLTLFPRRKVHLDTMDGFPLGMTHAEGTPCPFDSNHAVDASVSCCAFPAQAVVNWLKQIGEHRVADYLFEDIDSTQAILVSCLLRSTAVVIEKRYVGADEDDHGQSSDWVLDRHTCQVLPWKYSQFKETLALLFKATAWYEKVGSLGFGVRVRY